MNNSISDILASVTRAAYTTTPFLGLSPSTTTLSTAQVDLQQLTRAWVSERAAPELLPYPTDLMDRVMARIREQIGSIEDLTARMDAGTSFSLVVLQTELERFKFLVRSFLRARIAKIDTHTPHYLALHTSSSFAAPLLSATELAYAQRHSALLGAHYASTFLSAFPAKLQRLDDRAGAGGVGMVEGPDLDTAVWVRCLGVPGGGQGGRERNGLESDDDGDDDGGRVVLDARDRDRREGDGAMYGEVEVSCGWTADERREAADEDMRGTAGTRRSGGQSGGERIAKMRRGDVWLVRWSGVRDAVRRGECELL